MNEFLIMDEPKEVPEFVEDDGDGAPYYDEDVCVPCQG